MSETGIMESNSETEKPVSGPDNDDEVFPPFPDPNDEDFDDDISADEREHYKSKFSDLNKIRRYKLHCSACDRHLGSAARNESKLRVHPMLRTLMCQTCHTFYNSGEFDKGDDGSELYCRWCGQGGQVYCCSDCPHVFCAKCIKRNLGNGKIKEIENTDDWKCFKCNPHCLWDLRAICWALLRYCDLKNKITYKTEDIRLKEEYQKDCAIDYTDCCKNKTPKKGRESTRKKEDKDTSKKKEDKDISKKKEEKEKKKDNVKKEIETAAKKDSTASVIAKIPATIQVKKFASINIDESNLSSKPEKKAQKRSLSPKLKPIFIKNNVPIAPYPKIYGNIPSGPKKMRMVPPATITPIRISGPNDRMPMSGSNTYGINRYRPRMPLPPMIPFNGFNSNTFTNYINDNINLSLDSLTQGFDMSSMDQSDDIVCMPDLPLEPLCELQVNEDNDDDVQCMTPLTAAVPKVTNVVHKPALTAIAPENIIQMTDNDVTVNATTGGLKFRVDPQTLSSNKMYRLPDGRIFAINANPNMPGGYSATIVAVTENSNKSQPKGTTFAAKLNSVGNSNNTLSKTQSKNVSKPRPRARAQKTSSVPSTPKPPASSTETSTRDYDLNIPVEWYRYNLIDAIDALAYSTKRLQQLKKEATTNHLRTRSVAEMRKLHKNLDRVLSNSALRFTEIKTQLEKEMKKYVSKKMGTYVESEVEDDEDDDDDVEILPNNEEPISIDENSLDSITNDSQDLTTVISDHNESGEKSTSLSFANNESTLLDKVDGMITESIDEPNASVAEKNDNNIENHDDSGTSNEEKTNEHTSEPHEKVSDGIGVVQDEEGEKNDENEKDDENEKNSENDETEKKDENDESDMNENEKYSESDKMGPFTDLSESEAEKCEKENGNDKNINESEDKTNQENDNDAVQTDEIENSTEHRDDNSEKEDVEKCQDAEMTDELIENLLKDDTCDANAVSANDIPDLEDA